jgi:mono/diheme cytochrome c family protein/cytochrome c2
MKKAWKVTVTALALVMLVATAGAAILELTVRSTLGRKYETHHMTSPLPSGADIAAAERGQHLVVSRYGCTNCHGADLGGGVMLDDPALGSLHGPNLTAGRGGRSAGYTMSDWDRIVRHGVKPDGRAALMPSGDFFRMSDAELMDIVAYIRSLPPVDHEVAPLRLGLVGKILLLLGRIPVAADSDQSRASTHAGRPPDAGDTVAFGSHLAVTCSTCHRANFAGGRMEFGPPNWPDAANLTRHATGLADWSYEDFERALTRGLSRDGRSLREPMAGVVSGAREMLPDERKALWTYLSSLAPISANE